MPIYEYQREDGSVFEYLQKMGDAALETCPATGQKVRKIMSAANAVIGKSPPACGGGSCGMPSESMLSKRAGACMGGGCPCFPDD